jgi:hypothetical protein
MSFNRRFFLRGAGASLAIPLLPSLLSPREAAAQIANAPRAMVMYGTHHGGVWPERMFPATPGNAETRSYAGRTIRRFDLSLTTDGGGNASLSPVLTAPASRFTSRLLSKMNVMHGLDVPFYLAHHTGGYLGNFARNDGNGGDGLRAQREAVRRTIDQILAWSPSFYRDLGGVRERAIVLGPGISYNFSNPAGRSGPIQEVAVTATRPIDLFNQLFPGGGTGGGGGMTPRPPIVDQVREAYRRLATSSRLSAADKRRLDDHVDRVAELQRKLSATTPPVGSTPPQCATPTRPTSAYASRRNTDLLYTPPYSLDPNAHAGYYQVMNEIFALAFACGISRVASVNCEPTFSTFSGDWHQDVAHQVAATNGQRQTTMASAKQRFFSDVLLDLAARLDGIDMGDGGTMLDRSLVWWTHEHGGSVHGSQSMPVVSFGGAGGALRTGQGLDYRNMQACFNPTDAAGRRLYAGLVWHQWLGSVLEAMGVPRTEWQNAAVTGGYPDWRFAHVEWMAINETVAYPNAVWSATTETLPFLTP